MLGPVSTLTRLRGLISPHQGSPCTETDSRAVVQFYNVNAGPSFPRLPAQFPIWTHVGPAVSQLVQEALFSFLIS